MNNAVRQSPPEPAPAPLRRPTHASSAAVIQLSATPGRKADPAAPAAGSTAQARRGSRGGDLIFGAVLALILLIACLAWEVLADRQEVPHAAIQRTTQPAATVTLR